MKVYVQMDYLQNLGEDYLSASYRDFVPETTSLQRLLAKELKVVPSLKAQRIIEVERAIQRKEKQILHPIRKYIEKQIAAGAGVTNSYVTRGVLKIRKQNWFAYWKVIQEGIAIEEEPEEEVEYDKAALTAIHEWLTNELQDRAFSGWSIEEDYNANEAEEFTAPYKIRTFEFGLIRTARVDPNDVPYEETYYHIAYNKGAVQSYRMWKRFDYMGFNREMRRIGAWK